MTKRGFKVIKGAIFDVDGVILDSMGIWENLGERYLKGMGIRPEKDLDKKLLYITMEEGAEYMIKEYGLRKTTGEVTEELSLLLKSFYENEVSLKKGVREYLEGFAGLNIPMAIATSGGRANMEAALKRLGIHGFFKGSLTCAQVGKGKDDPFIYLEAARLLGERPENTVVFEDSPLGIRTAGEAGFVTAAVYDPSGEEYREYMEKAGDIYVRDFRHPDFKDFMKEV